MNPLSYFAILKTIVDIINATGADQRAIDKVTQDYSRTIYNHLQEYAKSPEPYPTFGIFYPRWAMLAMLLFLPLFVIDYSVVTLTPKHICALGLSCHAAFLPPPLQFGILFAIFLGVWALAFAVGRQRILGVTGSKPTTAADDAVAGLAVDLPVKSAASTIKEPENRIARFFWTISAFDRVTGLIFGAAIVAIFAFGLSARVHVLTPAGVALTIQLCTLAVLTRVWWWLLDHPKNNPYKRVPSLKQINDDLRWNLNLLLPVLNQRFMPRWGRGPRSADPLVDSRVYGRPKHHSKHGAFREPHSIEYAPPQQKHGFHLPFFGGRRASNANPPTKPYVAEPGSAAQHATGALTQDAYGPPTQHKRRPSKRLWRSGPRSSPYADTRTGSPPPPPPPEANPDMEI